MRFMSSEKFSAITSSNVASAPCFLLTFYTSIKFMLDIFYLLFLFSLFYFSFFHFMIQFEWLFFFWLFFTLLILSLIVLASYSLPKMSIMTFISSNTVGIIGLQSGVPLSLLLVLVLGICCVLFMLVLTNVLLPTFVCSTLSLKHLKK